VGAASGYWLSCCRYFTLDILKRIATVSVEVWMAKGPAVFPKLAFVGVFDLVKVVLVELANKGRKVGVFEHPRQNGLCEFVHVLHYEAVTIGSPRDNSLERGILQHLVELLDKVRCWWQIILRFLLSLWLWRWWRYRFMDQRLNFGLLRP